MGERSAYIHYEIRITDRSGPLRAAHGPKGAPFVLSRANRDVHAKFLLRNGADDVVYPEKQMASWAAVRYTADHVFDYVELTPEHSIFETAVPPSWAGKTVVELAVRQKYHINILATRHDGKLEPLPGPNHVFLADETIFLHFGQRQRGLTGIRRMGPPCFAHGIRRLRSVLILS